MKGDTICSLCTPKGKGAISLIRISGPQALAITKKLSPFLPETPESHRSYFGVLKNEKENLDQVLVTYFSEGKSFTGEESLEISCHGGEVYNEILTALLEKGARLAERGEFSLQAFSNGKMDLVQAEGLLQLIESKNKVARKQAFFQLEGRFSKELRSIEKKWLVLLSQLEADIDFSLEDLSTFKDAEIEENLADLKKQVLNLLSRYKPFENLQKALLVGIFGRTNSGKSSVFNALLEEDKAIVSKEEGTTRDLVEGSLLNEKGLNILLKDSAGFRNCTSEGEQLGQEKSKQLLDICDYRIVILDSVTFEKEEIDRELFNKAESSLFVFTKKDLVSNNLTKERLIQLLRKKEKNLVLAPQEQIFFVSSLEGDGISLLRQKLFLLGKLSTEDFLITNYRHYKGLKVMEKSLDQSLFLLKESQGERDLMALELRQGLLALYEILGKQIEDGLLDLIFKEFCIGK